MPQKQNTKSGYMGIFIILIGTALMIFLSMKMYFSPSRSVSEIQPINESGVVPVMQDGSFRGGVSEAKSVVDQQNAKNLETNKMINSF